MLRCSSPVALVGAMLAIGLSFSLQPTPTHAASVNPNASTATATYRLTSSTSIPVPDANIQGPQVVALITPTGSVVPPTLADGSQGSPLTVLPDSTGFDASHLVVALKRWNFRLRAARADVRTGFLRAGPSARRGSPFCTQHRQFPGQQPPGAPVADAWRHNHIRYACRVALDHRERRWWSGLPLHGMVRKPPSHSPWSSGRPSLSESSPDGTCCGDRGHSESITAIRMPSGR